VAVADVSNLGLALVGAGSNAPNIAIESGSAHHGRAEPIILQDSYLLFTGDFKRSGSDLVIDKDDRHVVINDYFKGEKRATLASPDGASLSGDLVNALIGEVQVAQAGATTSANTVIGKVSKLAGVANVVRNGVSVQLNVGDNVEKGDVVQTGSGSSLGIVFIDGTVFGLAASARMVLNEMVYDPNGSSNSSLLSLVQGTITFVAGETAKRGDMRVETPAATMGIRGTAVLAEIDFVVPAVGPTPPVRVQVLVEPGGAVGSLLLYSRSNPTQVIGQVNAAGQVTSISGSGDVSTQLAPPLSLAAQAIIEQTFREYFPNYSPRSIDRGSSSPWGGLRDEFENNPTEFQYQVPTLLPLRDELPFPRSPADDIFFVEVTRFNRPPEVNVSNVVVVVNDAGESSSFNIADRTTVVDPDINDVRVPYVAGSAVLVDVVAPPGTASNIVLTSLIVIDAATGAVSYDPRAFAFLAEGATLTYTIAFDSQSGPDTVHRALTLTIVGVNDVPVITSATFAVAEGGSTVLAVSDIIVSDPDSATFTFTAVNVTNGQFEILSGGSWIATSTFTSADIAAGHVRFTHDGSEGAPTFSVGANDGIASSGQFSGTINFRSVNDTPVAVADTNWAQEDLHRTIDGNVILGANHSPDDTHGIPPAATFADAADTDPDSVVLTVREVNGATSNVGVAIVGRYGTLTLNANGAYTYVVNNEAVQLLAAGQSAIDQFTYTVTDGVATSNTSTLTITVFGANDTPTVTDSAAITAAAYENAALFSIDLLAHASDVDNGAVLHVANVSALRPGVTLSGNSLIVDPNAAAFQHLAQGVDQVITVNYNVVDQFNAPVAQTATITITGTNDVPTVSAAITTGAFEGAASFSVDLLAHASDVDDGAVLHVADVSALPPGVSLYGNSLIVDPSAAAFQHLAQGVDQVITVGYNVVDQFNAQVAQTATITITGTNDAPTVSAITTAAYEGAASFSVDLLAYAFDVDDGAVLHVANVSALPAGVTLSGNSLIVDPSAAAFQHLAQGVDQVSDHGQLQRGRSVQRAGGSDRDHHHHRHQRCADGFRSDHGRGLRGRCIFFGRFAGACVRC
jgi:VCBS repeat-containing protein